MNRLVVLLLAAAVLSLATLAAQAAPPSVAQLLDALPDLPTGAQAATAWVDRRGTLINPALLQLRDALAAHRDHVAPIQHANALHHHQQGQVMAEALQQGMAGEGIDMRRMHADPAYAQQVQERLKRMTPAEQMAFAQRMNQPLNNDSRHVNAAQAVAQDAPALRAAAEAGEAYIRAQPERFARQAAIWAEAEAAVLRVRAKKLVTDARKPAPEWDNIGCDRACRAAWDAYAAQMLPLMIARDSEILAIRRSAWHQHRALVATELKAADRHLLASGYGAASRSAVNRQHIVGYDGAALAEIQALWERSVDVLKAAVVVAHCGRQVVLVPGAVCS